jgi:hypothetical protein
MKNHDDILTPNQDRAIEALLTTKTHKAAAKKAGIGERTLREYLIQPAFKEAYQEARRVMVEGTLAQIQRSMARAHRTLLKNTKCGKPEAENTAARAIIEFSLRGDMTDLAADVAKLKRKIEEREQREHRDSAAGSEPATDAGRSADAIPDADPGTPSSGPVPDPSRERDDGRSLASGITPPLFSTDVDPSEPPGGQEPDSRGHSSA